MVLNSRAKLMKFEFTEVKEFDVDKERRRINKCFKGALKKKLHKIVDLFCVGKAQECLDVINSLGRNEEDECSEKEYISQFISDAMWELCFNGNISIKP